MILAGDLLKWVIPKIGRFPRQVRSGLGSRIEAAHLEVRGGRDGREARDSEKLGEAQSARGGRRGDAFGFASVVFTWRGTRCGGPTR